MQLLSAATIRRCLVADPGHLMFHADYDQIELRIIAALAKEPAMIQAAKDGVSLHLLAANRLFGEKHVPDQYKLAKNINFTWAFAGGAGTMAERYSITYAEAKKLIADYEKAFPALVDFKRREQKAILRSALNPNEYRAYQSLLNRMFAYRSDTAEGREGRKAIQLEIKRLCYGKYGYAETPFGRRLIVDADKPYTVINYKVQSSAADIMKEGLLRIMADPELNPTVLLPIHDELLGQAPAKRARYFARRYADVMSTEFLGVPITAKGEVYGKSWGDGYRKAA